MTEYFALTDHGSVAAEKVIVATHFRLSSMRQLFCETAPGAVPLQAFPLKIREIPDGIYLEAKGRIFSLRGYEDTLLLGGITHRTGKEPDGLKIKGEQAKLYFPEAEITGQWAAQDLTLDGLPYIGNYSSSTPDLLWRADLEKWGMTGAMISALFFRILCREGKMNLQPFLIRREVF